MTKFYQGCRLAAPVFGMFALIAASPENVQAAGTACEIPAEPNVNWTFDTIHGTCTANIGGAGAQTITTDGFTIGIRPRHIQLVTARRILNGGTGPLVQGPFLLANTYTEQGITAVSISPLTMGGDRASYEVIQAPAGKGSMGMRVGKPTDPATGGLLPFEPGDTVEQTYTLEIERTRTIDPELTDTYVIKVTAGFGGDGTSLIPKSITISGGAFNPPQATVCPGTPKQFTKAQYWTFDTDSGICRKSQKLPANGFSIKAARLNLGFFGMADDSVADNTGVFSDLFFYEGNKVTSVSIKANNNNRVKKTLNVGRGKYGLVFKNAGNRAVGRFNLKVRQEGRPYTISINGKFGGSKAKYPKFFIKSVSILGGAFDK